MAICGLICTTCPVYLAGREPDPEIRVKMRIGIARICEEKYGLKYRPEEITGCDGCGVDAERLFAPCRECPIRLCARDRGLYNCAYCSDYPCARLEDFFAAEPEARVRLECSSNHPD